MPGKRTRTGCITCRIRRVKCDGQRPHCHRCAESRRTCDGYPPAQLEGLSRDTLAAALRDMAVVGPAGRVLAGPTSADETACFDFFRLRTAPQQSSLFPSDFWCRHVLQAAHVEPAVRSAVIALGALHRRWQLVVSAAAAATPPSDGNGRAAVRLSPPLDPEGPAMAAEFAERAAAWYVRAMGLAKDIREPERLLVLSLALAGFANLSGKWQDSRVHVSAGQRMLEKIKAAHGGGIANSASGSEIRSIIECLARLDLQGATFSEASAPYPYNRSQRPVGDDELKRNGIIGGLSDASARLVNILHRVLMLAAHPPEHDTQPELLVRRDLVEWEVQMLAYLEQNARQAGLPENKLATLSLRLYHAMMTCLFKAGLDCPQMDLDVALAEFERMVDLCAAILLHTQAQSAVARAGLSMDMGVLVPLYFTATRCRHPGLRRRAVGLLHRSNRQEGMVSSAGAAQVAAAIVNIEEACLESKMRPPALAYLDLSEIRAWAQAADQEPVQHWFDSKKWAGRSSWEGVQLIPEKERLAEVDVTADMESGNISLRLFYSDVDGSGVRRSGLLMFSL